MKDSPVDGFEPVRPAGATTGAGLSGAGGGGGWRFGGMTTLNEGFSGGGIRASAPGRRHDRSRPVGSGRWHGFWPALPATEIRRLAYMARASRPNQPVPPAAGPTHGMPVPWRHAGLAAGSRAVDRAPAVFIRIDPGRRRVRGMTAAIDAPGATAAAPVAPGGGARTTRSPPRGGGWRRQAPAGAGIEAAIGAVRKWRYGCATKLRQSKRFPPISPNTSHKADGYAAIGRRLGAPLRFNHAKLQRSP